MSRQSANRMRRRNKNLIPGNPISVGFQPWGVVVDERNRTVYVANSRENTISTIDSKLLVPRQKIALKYEPSQLVLNKKNSILYAISGSGFVTPIDTRNNTAGDPIDAGAYPDDVDVDERNNILFIADYFGGCITCINMATGKPTPTSPIRLSFAPQHIVVDEDNDTLYILNGDQQGYVVALSATPPHVEKSEPIAVGYAPWTMVLNRTNRQLYVGTDNSRISIVFTDNNFGAIGAIDLSTTGYYEPMSMAVDEKYQTLYVSAINVNFEGYLFTARSDSQKAGVPIPIGKESEGIAADQELHTVWVTSLVDNTVTPFSPSFASVKINSPRSGAHVAPGQMGFEGIGEPDAVIRVQVYAEGQGVGWSGATATLRDHGLWALSAQILAPGRYSAVAKQYVGSALTSQFTVKFTVD